MSMNNKKLSQERNIMTLVFPTALILLLFLEATFHFQLPVLYLVILAIQDIYLYYRSNKKLYLAILFLELCLFFLYWRSTTYSYFVQHSDPEVVAHPELFSDLIRQAQILNYRNYKFGAVIIGVLKTLFNNSQNKGA